MGACFIQTVLEGVETRQDVEKKFAAMRENAAFEEGHSYSGSWNMLSGISFDDTIFDSESAAADYICENTSKWGKALAVQFKSKTKEITKRPTFDGKAYDPQMWSLPICLHKFTNGSTQIFPADQLTPAQKKKCIKLFSETYSANKNAEELRRLLWNEIHVLSDPKSSVVMAEVVNLAKSYRRAILKQAKLAKAWKTFEDPIREQLYSSETKDTGLKWLIGGWAAE